MAAEPSSVRAAIARALLLAICALWSSAPLPVRAQEDNTVSASSSLYVRTDSDHTTVITPRVEVGAPIAEETRLDLVYTVDVWTSASIDIVTAASRQVTEQRDEIDVALEHAFSDLTLGAAYRYSTEYDYESNGGTLSGAYDFADNNATLALALQAYFDRVGRAGDPDFDRAAASTTARVSFTQVLDAKMFGSLVYELGDQEGYLSSPYRYVRFAMDAGSVPSTCVSPVRMCRLEENPDSRVKHAIALSLRRALGESISVGAGYRFYTDNWGMTSHTVNIDGALIPGDRWLIALGYRLYHQSNASHFKTFYEPMPLPEHYTSDKELSALSSHRVELELSRHWQLDDVGSELGLVLLAAPSLFFYHEFLLLDQITAFEMTLAVEVKL